MKLINKMIFVTSLVMAVAFSTFAMANDYMPFGSPDAASFRHSDNVYDVDGMINPTGTVWEIPSSRVELRTRVDGLIEVTFTRYHFPGNERVTIRWERGVDFGSFTLINGCIHHGGLAMREGRADRWAACSTGVRYIYPQAN